MYQFPKIILSYKMNIKKIILTIQNNYVLIIHNFILIIILNNTVLINK